MVDTNKNSNLYECFMGILGGIALLPVILGIVFLLDLTLPV